jgi:hypothetical protein
MGRRGRIDGGLHPRLAIALVIPNPLASEIPEERRLLDTFLQQRMHGLVEGSVRIDMRKVATHLAAPEPRQGSSTQMSRLAGLPYRAERIR